MTNKAMSDEELASITRDVMMRFRASIEYSPAERADFFAKTVVRLLYEIRRVRDGALAMSKVVNGAENVPRSDRDTESHLET